MVRHPLSTFGVQASLVLARCGLLPVIALLCLVGAAVLHFSVVPQTQRQTNLNQQRLAELQKAPVETSPSADLALHYAEIRAQLADLNDRGELLKALFQKAAEVGLTLAQADYRLQSDPDCNCQQMQITLPIKGTYLQVRAFVDAVLASMASLALDEINFRRENVKNPNVEVRLRLTLFLRTGD